MNAQPHGLQSGLRDIEALLRNRKPQAAERAAQALAVQWPAEMQVQVLLGHALRQCGKGELAMTAARQAESLAPADPAPRMLLVDLLQEQGRHAECVDALHALIADSGDYQATLLQDIAQRCTALGLHADAERMQARSLALQPDNPAFLYNHATALIALGRLDEAEAALDRVVALNAGDGDAWYNRATLRKQTPERNHVPQLQARLRDVPGASPERTALGYALAKELEDLGDYGPSFAALKQGADLRRRRLQYRVEDDIETMQLIAGAFDADFFATPHVGHADERPLFIVGLPRSGTTLVDRILSSHSAVHSRGETSDLAMALVRSAGPVASKADLVRRSTALDFDALGRQYCANLMDGGALRQIDKAPVNFLYLGLIANALPQARIIHLRRNPMDACYAMYKTLFRMAYPFSYDLGDLGRYWLQYDRLMAHWKQVLPADRFIEIHYEQLVASQQATSRELLAFAGLDWEDACLAFERNPQPSLTASAAQVRQPIYRSSVGLWQRYERELAPLREFFTKAGIDIETAIEGTPT